MPPRKCKSYRRRHSRKFKRRASGQLRRPLPPQTITRNRRERSSRLTATNPPTTRRVRPSRSWTRQRQFPTVERCRDNTRCDQPARSPHRFRRSPNWCLTLAICSMASRCLGKHARCPLDHTTGSGFWAADMRGRAIWLSSWCLARQRTPVGIGT